MFLFVNNNDYNEKQSMRFRDFEAKGVKNYTHST